MTATTAVGSGALAALAAGTDNVAVGRQAGNGVTSGGSNVIIGAGSAPGLQTGSSNIVIGAAADVPAGFPATSNYLNIGGVITGSMLSGSVSITLANGFQAYTQNPLDSSINVATTKYVDLAVAAGGGGGGGTIPYMQIGGLIISSIAGTHTTASFSISAGGCADSTGAAYISPSALSWAASNGNAINGTDASSSTLANSTTYHVFVCKGTSGTGSFVSASLSPTFPTGYNTSSRRIGSFKTTSAGAPIPYTSIEVDGGAVTNWLSTQALDANGTTVGTSSRTLLTLTSIPTGLKMQPLYRMSLSNVAYSGLIITSGDESDVAPSSTIGFTTAPGADGEAYSAAMISTMRDSILTTNTSAQIGVREAAASVDIYWVTRGWKDFRRS